MGLTKIFSVGAFLVLFLGASAGFGKPLPVGTELDFKIVTSTEDVRFSRAYLIKYLQDVAPAEWDRALQAGEVKIARGDLNDDGVLEVFLLLGNTMWCGSIGCTGLILQKVGDDWKEVGAPYFSDAIIMKEKMYGYHRLFSGHAIYTFRNGSIYNILEIEPRQITR